MEKMDPVSGPRMLIARRRIENCNSSLADEIPRANPKRIADHNSGRLLLEECLTEWGVPLDSIEVLRTCLLYTSPSPRDQRGSRMPSSA